MQMPGLHLHSLTGGHRADAQVKTESDFQRFGKRTFW